MMTFLSGPLSDLYTRHHAGATALFFLVWFFVGVFFWWALMVYPSSVKAAGATPQDKRVDAETRKDEMPPPEVAQRQTPSPGPGTHIDQKSTGPNSPNTTVIGDHNQVIINPPPSPYASSTTYDFGGGKHVVQGNRFFAEAGEQVTAFGEMQKRHDARDWPGLLTLCNEQIKKAPEWYTPYYFAAIAYANLGNRERAIRLLQYVNSNVGHIPKYNDSARLLKELGAR